MTNLFRRLQDYCERETFHKFLRYNLVQVASYVLEFSAFMLMTKLTSHLILANCIIKSFAAILVFFLHKNFTFGKKDTKKTFGEIFRFVSMFFVHLVLSSFLFYIFSAFLASGLAKILSDIFCVGLSFLLVRHVVFKESKSSV